MGGRRQGSRETRCTPETAARRRARWRETRGGGGPPWRRGLAARQESVETGEMWNMNWEKKHQYHNSLQAKKVDLFYHDFNTVRYGTVPGGG